MLRHRYLPDVRKRLILLLDDVCRGVVARMRIKDRHEAEDLSSIALLDCIKACDTVSLNSPAVYGYFHTVALHAIRGTMRSNSHARSRQLRYGTSLEGFSAVDPEIRDDVARRAAEGQARMRRPKG